MTAGQTNEPTFEEMLEELEAIVERLETGNLTLEESLEAYEASVKLAAACQQMLDQAELRITSIESTLFGGNNPERELS